MRRLPLILTAIFVALCTTSLFAQVMNFTTWATGLNYPIHLAKDSAGNVYIADTGSYTVRKCTPAGVCSVFAGTPGSRGVADGAPGTGMFYRPTQMLTNADGSLLIGDVNGIRRVAADGTITTWIDWNTSNIIWVEALARDSAGNVYASESGYRNVIEKITPSGTVTVFAGSPTQGYADGTGTGASFNNVTEMQVDAADNLYATDEGNSCIRKITPAGVVTTIAGVGLDSRIVDGPAGTNRLHFPMSLVLSGSDIYFTDEHTVRKLDASGNVTTLAGKAGLSGNRAATGTSARLYYAVSMTMIGSTLYVGDDNMKIWKATPGISDAAAIDQPTGVTGAARQLSVISATGASYAWSIPVRPATSSAAVTGSGATPTFTPDSAGDYSVRLDASSTAGTSVTYVDFTAHCDAQAPVIMPTPTSICAYQNGTATVSSPASYTSFAWTIVNGAIDSGANSDTVSFHSTSTAAVQLTVAVVDAAGCTATASSTIPMNGVPPAIRLDTADLCPRGDDAASIDASYVNVNWTVVNAYITNGSNSLNRMTFQGDGSGLPVQLTVNATDPTTGCLVSNNVSVPMRVLAKPAIRFDQPSMCRGGQNGASIDTTLYPPPPASQYSQLGGYEWQITNGTFVNGQFTSHATFVQDGSANPVQLTVIYRTNDSCQVTSDPATAPLNTPVPPTITPDSPDICPTASSFATINGTWSSINWTVTNATITNGQSTSRVDFQSDGSGPVKLTVNVTNASSCPASATVTVPLRVIPPPVISLDTPDVCPYGSDMASITGTYPSVWWEITNGTISSGQGTNRITFAPSTGMGGTPTQPVQLSVRLTDSAYCSARSSTVTVPLRTIPAPAISLDTPDVCPYGSDMASITGTYQNVWWDVTNGSITGGQGTNRITFAPSSGMPGTPTQPVQLTVTVTDSAYCTARSNAVTVPLRTIAAPAISLDTPDVCPYGSDMASITGTYQNVWWDITNGSITSGQGTNRITFAPSSGMPGTPTQPVQLTVRVTDNSYCTAVSNSVTVPLRTISAPAVSLDTPDVCPYGSDAASINGTYQNVWWDITNGYITGGQGTNRITFAPSSGMPGPPSQPVQLTVRVTDNSYCMAVSDSVTVPMRTIAAPAISVDTPDVCPNGTDSASIAGTWQNVWWDITNGSISDGQGTNRITFRPDLSGQPIQLVARVSDASFCQAASNAATVPIRTLAAPAVTLATPQVCAGGSDSATIDDTSLVIFSWSIDNGTITQGSTSRQATFTPSGTSTVVLHVTASTADGCMTATANVTVPVSAPQAAVTASGPTTFCAGGSVTLTASAGSSYLWSTGATTQSITVSTAGSYSVTVTSAAGCSAASQPVTVTVNALPTATISASGPTTFCAGGSVTLTASAGSGYTWLWSTGATTQSINVAASGTYSVTVTDPNGCSAVSAPVAVTVNPLPAIAGATAPQFVCWNGTGYTARVTNDPSVTYAWTTSSSNAVLRGGQNTNQLTFDVAIFSPSQTTIDLRLTATNASGCSTVQTFSIPLSNPDATVTASGATTFCKGGSVTLTAPSGYTYLWSNNATTQSVTVSASGTYRVTVSDATGCAKDSSWTTVTVNDPPKPTITAYGSTAICDGSSLLLVASGPGPWLWSTGATTQSITVTDAGSYTVTTTDSATTCSVTSDPTVTTKVTPPPAPVITVGTSCAMSPVTASVQHVAGVTVTWRLAAGSITSASGDTVTFSPATNDTLTATFTNAGGCTSNASAPVTVHPTPDSTITASGPVTFCAGGSVTLTAPAGMASYLWNNGATTQSITVGATGSYHVTVTSADGCSATSTNVNVTANSIVTPTITFSVPSFCPETVISATAPEGYATYNWSASAGVATWGQGTSVFSIDKAGSNPLIVTLTVTDANGCSASASATLQPRNFPAPVITVDTTRVCPGGIVHATSSSGPYTGYGWSVSNGTIVSGDGTSSVTIAASQSGGPMTISLSAYGNDYCTSHGVNTDVIVDDPLAKPAVTTSGSPALCPGGSVTLTASASGGDGTYAYQWYSANTPITGATSQTYAPPAANGSYTVVVTDGHGCTSVASDPVTVTLGSVPNATITAPASICSGTTGNASVPAISGGSYAWTITGGTITSAANTNAITFTSTTASVGLSVTVTNANACSASSSKSVTINANPAPVITAPTSMCAGSTATASVPAISGASYAWTITSGSIVSGAGSNSVQFTSSASSVSLAVTVTDPNACSGSASANVTVNPPPPLVFSTVPDAVCINVEAAQEVQPQANVTYSWTVTNGTITQDAGHRIYYIPTANPVTLRVIETDLNGCTTTDQRTIPVHTPVTPTISPNGSTTFCSGGSVTLTASSGISYLWSTGETTQSISVNSTGAYHVTVRTADSCSATSADTNVTVNTRPNAAITAPSSFCSGTSASASVAAVSGGSYAWTITGGSITSGANTNAITFTSTTGPVNLSVTVTNASNCSSTASSGSIAVNPLPSATITAPSSFCSGTSASASVAAVSGGSYAWTITGGSITSGANTNAITFTSTTGPVNLSVTVTNANNCSTSSSANVVVNPRPSATITAPQSFCSGTTASASVAAVTGGSYAWTITGGTITSATNTNAITFTSTTGPVNLSVTVTNASNCNASSSANVTVNALPVSTITAPSSFCTGTTATASVPSVAGSSYAWTITGGSITSATNTNAITFTSTTGPVNLSVTVTNTNNCVSSSSANVGVNPLPNATITAPSSFCSGTSATASVAAVTNGSYAWTITGGTITAGAGTNSITFTSTTGPVNLGVTVTNANGCSASSSATSAVTASTAMQQPANKSIARNVTTTLTVSATGANLTYKWYSGQYPSGTVIGTTATVTVGPYKTRGTYYFYVEVTGTCGMVRSSAVTVTVN